MSTGRAGAKAPAFCAQKKKIGKIGKKSAERFVIKEKERQKKTA